MDMQYSGMYSLDDNGPEQKPDASGGKRNTKKDAGMNLFDWIQCIVTAILCGILIFVFIGRIIGVDGSSMVPTLENGDRVILSNLFFTPKYGDIVVLKTDNTLFDDHPLVKRVIATAGQTIDIDFAKGEVIIDGYVIEEPYIADLTREEEDFDGPVTVPEGFVFVMGDNRNKSTDSRSSAVGLVDTRRILGKVYWVIIPGEGSDHKRDWHRLGSVYN